MATIQAADGCIGWNKVKRRILEGYARILAWVCKVRKRVFLLRVDLEMVRL